MPSRKLTLVIVGVIAAGALAAVAVSLPDLNRTTATTTTAKLPAGCVKPAGGFLMVASLQGFNDSVDHGVPQNNWPVMNVKLGQNVTIVVCNADSTQSHGFQIDHYYSAQLVSIAPGQVLRVSFIATQAGSFRVYCQILCTVHWAMQNGQLIVS
ncbi:MAG: hypothetical protein JRN06_11390 [Nitrososphaerota archaeon]|nr:hypothetical protein [Nitrososphaerota archaeon]MDG7024713.1 hypothetical protein [Nitrososphaerota archaeon]